MQKTHLALLAATALSGLAGINAVTAQETVLGPIIVSAGLSPLPQNEMGRSYTVVDREQIERTKPAYMIDILRQVPGISVSVTGSAGGLTQVRMRGAEANHVLVLIDGVPVSDNSSGEYDFGRMQATNIERVEVLRGPQSAFWGSKALSGVINIITNSGSRNGFSSSVATEFGTDGTKMGALDFSVGQDNFDVSGSVTLRHTDGFNISSLGNELDGATHFNADLKFNADVTPHLAIDGVVRYGVYHADNDSEGWPSRVVEDTFDTLKGDDTLAALGFTWESEDGSLFQSGRISSTRVDKEYFDDFGAPTFATTGDIYKASYQAGKRFETPSFGDSRHTVAAGYDLVTETFNQAYGLPFNSTDLKSRSAHSLVLEYRGTFADQLNLSAAVRHDINDSFADFTTYSLSGAWDLPGTETTLHASVGTGAKNPTFYEQFGYSLSYVGNPHLLPETSLGWDIGVRQSFFDEMMSLDVTYFAQDLENKISAGTTGSVTTPVNIAGISTRQGIEVSAMLDLFNGFTASASYNYTDAQDPTGAREVRRPMHAGVVNLAYAFEDIPLRLNSELVMVGEALDAGKVLPEYSILNAGLNYQVNDNLEVYGRVHNLFDTSYQTAAGYNSPGRTFYVGAKAKF